jgi:predicted nucleic acid-binding Zn ribbon protein
VSEAAAVYLRMKELFTGTPSRRRRDRTTVEDPTASKPFGAGRDPRGLGDVMTALTSQLGWTEALAKSDLMEGWVELAGEETAKHSFPEAITDGALIIRCDSTAWASQLGLLRSELLRKAAEHFPRAGIETIHIRGPHTPNWKHGPRSIPGRGPRDTYG